MVRKEGWEPYSLKVKYFIPLTIYLVVIILAVGWEWSHKTTSIVNVIGIIILITVFVIQYVVGVRRIFFDLIVKLKFYDFVPLIGWLIGSTIIVLIETILVPEIIGVSELISTFIFLGFGALIYSCGIIIVIKDIKDISI